MKKILGYEKDPYVAVAKEPQYTNHILDEISLSNTSGAGRTQFVQVHSHRPEHRPEHRPAHRSPQHRPEPERGPKNILTSVRAKQTGHKEAPGQASPQLNLTQKSRVRPLTHRGGIRGKGTKAGGATTPPHGSKGSTQPEPPQAAAEAANLRQHAARQGERFE